MATIKLDFSELSQLTARLKSLAGDCKQAAEEALKASRDYVTPNIHQAMQAEHLPAKGKYSTGATEKTIVDDAPVKWMGTTAQIDVGFDLNQSLVGQYLIRGTPKMQKDTKLYEAIEGSGTKNRIKSIQEDKMLEAIRRAGG